MMHLRSVLLLILLSVLSGVLHAQAISMGGINDDIPRFAVGANYNYFHANAPPGQCGCFSLNGGSGTILINVTPVWAAVADIAVAHANNVDNTSQNITIVNYLFGARYTRRNSSRFVPYGEVLFGGAKEDVNFQFTINRNSFGLAAGGGVSTRLKRRLGLTIAEFDYVYTQIPNAANDRQNNIRISTGVTYNFGR
ncbi:outer membrane beta-barrel protein [Tunturibacter empetritectus]|uniref:Opacity protein-like surface antigen n=1 Tax=Tunturiibacter empetritectus TaxID=3069691 RepID=A0A7W8IH11_9BACT|nr:outer membrane beta-barrel protein [Edaphobacter lichenicola]MBB5317029.1 opacity protein-like surface antigen [Edaphobacter lichenicola]